MDTIDSIKKILIYRNRGDLAKLLEQSVLSLFESDTYGSYLYSRLTTAIIQSPIRDYDRLKDLSEEDKKVIMNALLEVYPPQPNDIEINSIEFRLDSSKLETEPSDFNALIQEIETQRNLMIAVATGGPRIDSVNDEYKQRKIHIEEELARLSLSDTNPYNDLWEWYGKWSSGDLPSYRSRRQYISELYGPLIQRLKSGVKSEGAKIFEEPTGWVKVDRCLGEVRRRLEEALTEEQFQAIGLLCRETLISLAQIVYDTQKHDTDDGIVPSKTDGKRMLDAYLSVELAGDTNQIARKHAKASLDWANDLQHRRTATFRHAALCAEATTSLVNMIAIISGQRDP